jgi:hypothetical protein
MENFKELSFEENLEISGGNRLQNLWKGIKLIYQALEIQDSVNEVVDGWNSVDCDCK